MKKLFFIPLALLFACIPLFTSCSDDGWTEVQSITIGTHTIYASRLYLETKETDITAEEYYFHTNQEIQDIPNMVVNLGCDIPVNRDELTNVMEEAISYVGKTYYRMKEYQPYGNFYKQRITGYKLRYVSVKILKEGYIGIKYFSEMKSAYATIRILPLSYEITYFND